tara:strand:+ start:308 stop:481 length:174 start_codon:yes stop_codon:yes gene_type:complete
MKKPKLVVVSGRPGSGKTTLAKKLGELIKLPVFCRDDFRGLAQLLISWKTFKYGAQR